MMIVNTLKERQGSLSPGEEGSPSASRTRGKETSLFGIFFKELANCHYKEAEQLAKKEPTMGINVQRKDSKELQALCKEIKKFVKSLHKYFFEAEKNYYKMHLFEEGPKSVIIILIHSL